MSSLRPAQILGAYFLYDGIIAIVSAVAAPKGQKRWWVTLLEGIVGISIGLLTCLMLSFRLRKFRQAQQQPEPGTT